MEEEGEDPLKWPNPSPWRESRSPKPRENPNERRAKWRKILAPKNKDEDEDRDAASAEGDSEKKEKAQFQASHVREKTFHSPPSSTGDISDSPPSFFFF